jgi:hypothetical protein
MKVALVQSGGLLRLGLAAAPQLLVLLPIGRDLP